MEIARLKIWGAPVESVDKGKIAVWESDDITILKRTGSRYFCRVEYGCPEYRKGKDWVFHAWLPKKWLRVRRAV